MTKSKSKSKGSDKLWLAFAIMSVVLAGFIAFMVCTDAFTSWNKYCQWGHDYDENGVCTRNPKHVKPVTDADTEDYFQIQADASSQKLVTMSYINRKNYAAIGIPASVESAYTLTATIAPTESDNQRVVWSVEFENPDSDWAKGKDPANYVKAQPTVDGSNQAIVTCLQAFGEPINVIAQSEDNEGATASCLCDYVKRVVGVDLNIATDTLMFGTVYTVNATPQYGVGTIEGEYSAAGYTIGLTSSISSALNGLKGVSESTYNGSVTATYTATYECYSNTNAKLNVDISSGTFSFNGSDAFEVFGSYSEASTLNATTPLVIPGGGSHAGSIEEAISKLRSVVNNTFKEKISEVSGTHMIFTFNFTYEYEGKSYVETTATAELKFDAETLAIHVVSISLDNDHIVF